MAPPGGEGDTEREARELCHEERQTFIDCMFVKSKAVQGGACTIDECIGGGAAGMPAECTALYKAFLHCRRQLVRPPTPKRTASAAIAPFIPSGAAARHQDVRG